MAAHRERLAFLFATLGLVIVMVFPVALSISAARPEPNSLEGQNQGASPARQPSSLGPDLTPQASIREGSTDEASKAREASTTGEASTLATRGLQISIPCTQTPSGAHLTTPLHAVRLDGQTCLKLPATATSILNTTNGFAATIFPNRIHHFTTDYIELEPGENQIVVQLAASSGSPRQWAFTVTRTVPSQL
jgi:hypothetical protein